MDDNPLTRHLQAVGMACFVHYYERFADANISNADVIAEIFRNEGYTEKSCRSRTGHARGIIRANQSHDALQRVVDANPLRVSEETRERAANLRDHL
jgi:hypothetical protein